MGREITIADAVERYLAHAKARAVSPSTLDAYRYRLKGKRVIAYMQDVRPFARLLMDVDTDWVVGLVSVALDEGVSPLAAEDYRRAWVSLLSWAEDEGLIDRAAKVRRLRIPERHRRVLSCDEERKILDACRTERDRVLVAFLCITGLRRSECAAVQLGDIVVLDGFTLVRVRQGKGRRDRFVPLDTPARKFSDELAVYVRAIRPKSDSQALWLTCSGRPLSSQAIKTMLRRIREGTGIEVFAHAFRHTFATRALAAGVPERSLRKAGGWASARSLDPYIHQQTSDLLADWGRRRD